MLQLCISVRELDLLISLLDIAFVDADGIDPERARLILLSKLRHRRGNTLSHSERKILRCANVDAGCIGG